MSKILRLGLLLVLAASFDAAIACAASSPNICEREMTAAAAAEGVPIGVLYAVGLTETGRKGSLHPYALNIEGKAVFATSREDALAAFERARRRGKKLIDLGCMQINHHYHGRNFASVAHMLEPRDNVCVFHAIRPRVPPTSGQSFHQHPATRSMSIRPPEKPACGASFHR